MTDETIRVISLWQPYASLLFEGRLKRHETRSWRPVEAVIGTRIAIHAAQKRPSRAFAASPIGRLCASTWGDSWRRDLPYGAIIGTVVVSDVYPTERGAETQADWLAGDWTPGRWAWRLIKPMRLNHPVPEVGRQGWWSIDTARLGPGALPR